MKHKIFFLTLIILLSLCQTSFALSDTITIGLFYGSTAQERVDLISGDGLYIGDTSLGTEVYAICNNDCVTIYDMNGTNILFQQPDNSELLIYAGGNIMKINGKRYRGTTKLIPADGRLTVISIANIDDYLCGVLPKETYTSWNIEALKAQAVVSRGLVQSAFVGKHKSLGFDVCTTTNCQVYGGYDVENANTTKAVYDTKNTIAWYDGKPAHTLFSASNGGYVEKSQNVWGGTYPYLLSFKDEYEKTDEIKGCVWTVELTAQEIRDAVMNKTGKDIGDVTGMEVINTAESGRVTLLRVYGTNDSCDFEKEKSRTLFNLKSQLFSITPPAPAVVALTDSGVRQLSGYNALSADGNKSVAGEKYVASSDGTYQLASSSNDKYVISGRGYGHGVGMSQWGSMYMAEAGKTYEEIIKYYFPGVSIYPY